MEMHIARVMIRFFPSEGLCGSLELVNTVDKLS